jgi:hypothetical protein
MKAEGEERYSTTHSLTSKLDGVGRESHAPAALSRQREAVLIAQKAG